MVVVVASAAGVLAGAPPELASTLALAKSSACKQAAVLIEQGDCQSALRNLQSAISSPFPWQIEVTNGYQNGFFLNALMGYCLEQADDPPKAYRAYQNSRAYIDEDRSLVTPEPRLEVYVGIGRMCNAVGRYTDSFTWLDAARYEGAGNSNIVIAADRALAKRAIEIGDYYDAITNFEDLASITTLTREEYKQLAQLYFWTHRDREGFRHVLNGLTLLGIDNDLGVKDPMVDCFLNNIMRADDSEIRHFCDVLEYAVVQARAVKGDEPYLAWLCKANKIMDETYGLGDSEAPIEAVSRRIDQVRQRLQRYPDSAPHTNLPRVLSETSAKRGLPDVMAVTRASGATSAMTFFEDQIMRGDWFRQQSLAAPNDNTPRRLAYRCYQEARLSITNSPASPLVYDGFPAAQSLQVGIADLAQLLLLVRDSSSPPIADPGREVKCALNNADWAAPRYFPLLYYYGYHPPRNYDHVLRAPPGNRFRRAALGLMVGGDVNEIAQLYDRLNTEGYVEPLELCMKAAGAFVALDRMADACDALLDALSHCDTKSSIPGLFADQPFLLTEAQTERYMRIRRGMIVRCVLVDNFAGLADPRLDKQHVLPEIGKAATGRATLLGNALLSGSTNEALKCAISSLKRRNALTKRLLGCCVVVYPNHISAMVRPVLGDCPLELQNMYLTTVACSRHETASNEVASLVDIGKLPRKSVP